MACNLTSGRTVDCKDSVGGIKTLFLSDYANNAISNATFSLNGSDLLQIDTAGFADWSTATGTPAAIKIYRYELRPNVSSMTVNVTSDPATGTTFFQQTLSLTLQKLDITMMNEIKLIAYGRPQAWVLDSMDNLWFLGAENGMDMTGGTIVTGAAKGDLSGYTIELAGEEKTPLYMIKQGTLQVPGTGYPFDGLSDEAALNIAVGT